MKELSDDKPVKLTTEEALKLHDAEYAEMIKSYPQLLKTSFS